MTRLVVYSAAFVALLAVTTATLLSILSPNWINYTITSPSSTITRSIGLHRACLLTSPALSPSSPSQIPTSVCNPFPSPADCSANPTLCPLWRTASFALSLSLVLELATTCAFIIILAGGKQSREVGGWKVLGGMLGAVTLVLVVGVGLVAYVRDYESMFEVPGWRLGKGWGLAVAGAVGAGVCGVGLVGSRYLLGEEGDYELLEEGDDV